MIAGAYVPYIVRLLYKGRNTWELIGETYCYGFMLGEALKLLDLKWETMEIV
ncbi:uncharacterized protein K452DRAFT_293163 [Aplosporella prunicola CBS 121167]|uniref:Uncharacterized protein n=1 Tax=Aplosporella prunicola CBS 121167 TaxID=1176127 RepID=A0A6A6AV11_9PEZI|nr:uncharacterized protein K452DRAFT_293163 [Aplosporella prunicola CBS 121167]KAF2135510.1 hypothetical protein K452DRAFT_293163 [Aplosporella prunicola CBS 121167]